MISLEQIRTLETRVQSAVEEIARLRAENQKLTDTLAVSERKLHDLETLLGEFRSDQDEIEATINRTLEHLDRLEDGLLDDEQPESARRPPGGAEQRSATPADKPKGDPKQPARQGAAVATSDGEDDQQPNKQDEAELDIF